MSSRLPPLNPLRAFEAAARRLSVSRAAEELHVTHGAVSHQIKALEEALGVRLFLREGGRLRLTPEGETLLPPVAGALDAISEATARIKSSSADGEIAIGCVPALLSFWLVPKLNLFMEHFPHARLRIVPGNDPSLLQARAADVCIHYGDGAYDDPRAAMLAEVSLFPVCSPALANDRPLRELSDLAGHVLLHADDGTEWDTWFRALDMGRLADDRQHFMGDARLALDAATYGSGIALGDNVTASYLLESGRLIVPFARTIPAPRAFYVVCRPDVDSTPLVRAFVDWLLAAMGDRRAPDSVRVSASRDPGPSVR